MEHYTYIFIAFFFSLLLFIIRNNEKSLFSATIEISVGWCILLYGIVLGFSISNFYAKYIAIRDSFIKEITNLKIIYKIFEKLPNKEKTLPVLDSINNYINSVPSELNKSLKFFNYNDKTKELYNKMNDEIINYTLNNNDSGILINNNILLRLSSDDFIKQIINEMKVGNYYINFLWTLLIFIFIPIYFINVGNKSLQFILDFCIFSILLSCIYLCEILNNPFIDSPISLKFYNYVNF
jgi:hypothetical protein